MRPLCGDVLGIAMAHAHFRRSSARKATISESVVTERKKDHVARIDEATPEVVQARLEADVIEQRGERRIARGRGLAGEIAEQPERA